jgi:hypothetical protein
MKSLAAREQAEVPSYSQRPHAEQSLEELATDNAVEGCVRETFAALLAVHQSEHGTDPSIREAFGSIADGRDAGTLSSLVTSTDGRSRSSGTMSARESRLRCAPRSTSCDASAAQPTLTERVPAARVA